MRASVVMVNELPSLEQLRSVSVERIPKKEMAVYLNFCTIVKFNSVLHGKSIVKNKSHSFSPLSFSFKCIELDSILFRKVKNLF